MGVIEIKCVAGDSIDQCGVGDPQPVAGAEHHGLRLAAEQTALLPDDPRGRFLCAGDGEAEVIEQATGALVQNVGGYVVGAGVPNEVEQGSRLDGGAIVVAARVLCRLVCITEFLSV